MKKLIVLCACFLITASTVASSAQSWKDDPAFINFWQKFKTAVISNDKETIVALSSFPIRMPGRVRAVKNAADLRLRYNEVFTKRTSAAKCFARDDSDPVGQPEGIHPKAYAVFCDLGTGDVLSYRFKLTSIGWKFVRLAQDELPD